MLEHNDIEILKKLMQGVVKESEHSILNKVDIRLSETEQHILEKVDVRIAETEQNILEKVDVRIAETEQNILEKVNVRIAETEQNILEKVDVRIAETEQSILEKVDVRIAATEKKFSEQITCSENLILNELDRVQTHMEREIAKTQENLDELKQFYRIDRLEADNTSLLLKMYNDMQKEIAEIKAQIA